MVFPVTGIEAKLHIINSTIGGATRIPNRDTLLSLTATVLVLLSVAVALCTHSSWSNY